MFAAQIGFQGGGPHIFVFNDTINADNLDAEYNVATEAAVAGWNGTDIVVATITINNSARLRGPKRTGAITKAFNTGALPANSTCDVTLTDSTGVEVWGGGGRGGFGGSGHGSGTQGTAGGDAFYFQCDGSVYVGTGCEVYGGRPGGGGGAGAVNFLVGECTPFDGGDGGDGWPSAGSDTLGGTGAPGPSLAGDGGDGADKSSNNATAGQGSTCHASCIGDSHSGGAASSTQGYAVRKNGYTVSVTGPGTISGTVG